MKRIIFGALCALAVTAANADVKTFKSAKDGTLFTLDTDDIADLGYGVRLAAIGYGTGAGKAVITVDCDKWNAATLDDDGQTLYPKLEPGTILHSVAITICGAAVGGKKRAGLPS